MLVRAAPHWLHFLMSLQVLPAVCKTDIHDGVARTIHLPCLSPFVLLPCIYWHGIGIDQEAIIIPGTVINMTSACR